MLFKGVGFKKILYKEIQFLKITLIDMLPLTNNTMTFFFKLRFSKVLENVCYLM